MRGVLQFSGLLPHFLRVTTPVHAAWPPLFIVELPVGHGPHGNLDDAALPKWCFYRTAGAQAQLQKSFFLILVHSVSKCALKKILGLKYSQCMRTASQVNVCPQEGALVQWEGACYNDLH